MTLTTTASRITYQGSGTTGPFAVPFRVLVASDLLLTTRSAIGTEVTLALVTDYTVAGAGDATCSVTLVAALAVGATLSIRRAPPITQPTAFSNQGAYFGSTHETALDRQTMEGQSLADQVARGIGLSESFDPADFDLRLGVPVPNQVLAANGGADGVEWRTVDTANSVLLPGQGRTVASLTNYLANNAVLNIRDYGAVGDGVADDTAAIQRAIDAVPTGGGCVLVHIGTFKVTGQLTLKKAGTVLMGYGPLSNIVSTLAGAETVFASGLDDLGVVHLQISGAHGGCINFQSSGNSRVEHCRLTGAVLAGVDGTRCGVKVGNVSGFRFTDNFCFGNGLATEEGGADFRANFGSTQIVQSIIARNRCVSTAVSYNIALFDPRACLVAENYCSGALTSPSTTVRLGYGIMLYETGGVTLANVCDNVVSNNTIVGVQGTGIYNTGPLRSVISANTVRDTCSVETDGTLAVAAIVVEGPNAKGAIVIGNKVYNSGKDGIQISGADDCVVSGNQVDTTTGNGISLRGAVVGANISGNVVANVSARAIGSYGNAVQTGVVIANNKLDTLAVPGSTLGISTGALAAGWIVNGNLLTNCNGRGMDLNGSGFIAHHNVEDGVPWFEGISADQGDHDVTLSAYAKQTQRFATGLTANRVLTLPASGTVFADARYRVVREDVGAFTLTVKDAAGTTLKVMGAGGVSWADFEWNTNFGGFWRLTAAGAL